ncbi:MAG: cytochrome c1 [Pseudomonadota bacterium]
MLKFLRSTAVAATLALGASAAAFAAGGSVELEAANNNVGNQDSLQRGAKYFMNYCSGCHSAKYVRYNTLGAGLGLSDEQLIENLMFNADKTHETIDISMRPDDAKNWFNKTPPDLSLIARSRGTDYLYTFLRGYYQDESTPTGWNNTVLAGTSMPYPLWALEGIKVPVHHDEEHGETDGHGEAADHGEDAGPRPGFEYVTAGSLTVDDYDQVVRDIVNYLDFISEPVQLERKTMGVWVMAFLVVFFLLSLMLKKEIWKPVK